MAIYDYKNLEIYLAGATPVQPDGSYTPAYDRAYLKLPMKVLFTEEPPREEEEEE